MIKNLILILIMLHCVNSAPLTDNGCIQGVTCIHGECIRIPFAFSLLSAFSLLPNEPCGCNNGWKGQYCNIDIDECEEKNLCTNGAKCINKPGGFDCLCQFGFSGSICENYEEFDNAAEYEEDYDNPIVVVLNISHFDDINSALDKLSAEISSRLNVSIKINTDKDGVVLYDEEDTRIKESESRDKAVKLYFGIQNDSVAIRDKVVEYLAQPDVAENLHLEVISAAVAHRPTSATPPASSNVPWILLGVLILVVIGISIGYALNHRKVQVVYTWSIPDSSNSAPSQFYATDSIVKINDDAETQQETLRLLQFADTGDWCEAEKLLKLGVNPVLHNETSIFHSAAKQTNLQMLKKLFSQKEFVKFVNAIDYQNMTPLMILAKNDFVNAAAIQYLISIGADPNFRGIEDLANSSSPKFTGRTALHYAVKYGNFTAVRALVKPSKPAKKKTNVNAVDLVGKTPLIYAAEAGMYEILEFLLAADAKRDMVDDFGHVARDYAFEAGFFDIVDLLENVVFTKKTRKRKSMPFPTPPNSLPAKSPRIMPPSPSIQSIPSPYVDETLMVYQGHFLDSPSFFYPPEEFMYCEEYSTIV